MKSESASDLNAQFFPLLIRILFGGEHPGGKMETIPPSQCSWEPWEWMFKEMFVYTLQCHETTPGLDLFKLYFY